MDELGNTRRKKLRLYAAENSYGPRDFSSLFGGRESYWSDLLRTDTKPFGEKAARKFETNAGLPDGWLDKSDLPLAKVTAAVPRTARNDVVIPQYNTGGRMGHGLVLRDQPGIIKAWHVSPDWVRQNVPSHSGVENLCIVTGFGPSMMPMYNPGDPLLLDRGVTRIEFDAVYFFALGNEGFIKLVQRVPDSGGVRLRAKSKNPDYDPFWIDESMDFQVFGRVLRVWKGENI